MVYAVYVRDDGVTQHAVLVDADHYSDLNRGWRSDQVDTLDYLPRLGRPRRVYGTSASTGRRGSAVCGTPFADLWTGVVNIFTVETNDRSIDTMTVTGRRGERFRSATVPAIPNPYIGTAPAHNRRVDRNRSQT